jgi:hypothetical protein
MSFTHKNEVCTPCTHLIFSEKFDLSDLIDQATLEADWSFGLRMRDPENNLIGKIKQSLFLNPLIRLDLGVLILAVDKGGAAMKNLIMRIAKALVDNPEQVYVTVV